MSQNHRIIWERMTSMTLDFAGTPDARLKEQAMSECADRKPKTIKIPGPDHPITIERNAHRIVVAVAGRVVADTRAALTLREASYPPVSIFHARTWTPRCSSGRPTPLTALKERVPAAQVISLYVPGRSGSIGPRIVGRRDRAPREDRSP